MKEINSADWENDFKNYLNHVECPFTDNLKYQIEWLLGKAIQVENYALSGLMKLFEGKVPGRSKLCDVQTRPAKENCSPARV